ncbi:alpha/beta fold hydrolase [Mesobacillus subterraneus]|uniref:alpha/beta fold hydrolase n=1 Tax=Mesobacillus subterraneus TaxID=285983 RepID=UPI001CFEAC8B|nr:alpha/beta hydrolase [Mesobacillus subterraneus]
MNCKVRKGTIHYEVIGEGFPLLVLHAMGTDHRSMKGWLEPVFNKVEGFQRVYIDVPAHGRSAIDDRVKSTDDLLGNLLDFIDDTFGEREFSLVGASFGGYLAQGIFHNRRSQVKGICLLAPALHLKKRDVPERVILDRDEDLLSSLDPDIRAAFETLFIYQNEATLAAFMKEIQPGRTLANREFLASDWKANRYYLTEEPFHDVQTLQNPALIILGKQDYICGYKDHLFLLDKFPNSTMAVLDRAGHMLQIEKREVVQALMSDWLNGSH